MPTVQPLGQIPGHVRCAELPTAGRSIMLRDFRTKLHKRLWGDHARRDCPVCLSQWVMERLITMRDRIELSELQEADDGRRR